MTNLVLTKQDLRRLALSRQLLDGRAYPTLPQVFQDLGCIQLDPIRAVERTHLLVLWSRLGAFDVENLQRLRWQEKAVFEYWAHAASMVPTADFGIHRWHMEQVRRRPPAAWFTKDEDILLPLQEQILARLEQGPALSREIVENEDRRWPTRWSSGRFVPRLLDSLWFQGFVTVVGRKGGQRVWGLLDEFLPEVKAQTLWTAHEVTRVAAQKSIRALGAATPRQIRQHFTRRRYPHLEQVLQTLSQEGVLLPVSIIDEDGQPLPGPWYLHREDLALLAEIQNDSWQGKTALLSPFDNLICDRDRTELLFDFHYRIEIYVPKAKRRFGYYVLPILHEDRLIGRIDPRLDRNTKTLHIHNVYAEENAPGGRDVVAGIGRAIADLARWLGADDIEWGTVPATWKTLLQLAV